MKKDQKIKQIIALLLLSYAFLFYGIGDYSLKEPDEGRYAEIPREMNELHDYTSKNHRFYTGLMRFHSNSSEQMNGPSGSQMRSAPSSVPFFSIFLCAGGSMKEWRSYPLPSSLLLSVFLPWHGLLRQICSLRCGYFFRSSSSMDSTEKKKHYSSIFFT